MTQTIRFYGPEIGEDELLIDAELVKLRDDTVIFEDTDGDREWKLSIDGFQRRVDNEVAVDHNNVDTDNDLWDVAHTAFGMYQGADTDEEAAALKEFAKEAFRTASTIE